MSQAQERADRALPGSLERAAAGCVVVLLATSKTLAGARKNLHEIPIEAVRQAADELLDRLAHEGEPT